MAPRLPRRSPESRLTVEPFTCYTCIAPAFLALYGRTYYIECTEAWPGTGYHRRLVAGEARPV